MEVSFVLPVFDLRTCSLQSVSLSSAYSCRNNLWRPSLSAFFTLSLFRATNHQGHIVDKPLLSPAVDPRLRKYTRDANIDSGETLHSFRSGCTLTLAFSGSPLADIVSHVGWSSSKTAFNYLNLAHGWGSSWPTCFCSFAVSGGLSHLWRLQLLKRMLSLLSLCPTRLHSSVLFHLYFPFVSWLPLAFSFGAFSMGFSLRLGCWSPLSGYLAFYMSLFSVAARLPYLNRSAGKIGANRILFTAVLPKPV